MKNNYARFGYNSSFKTIGVIKIQRDLLDKNYLINWSQKLGVYELLLETFKDAGIKL